MRKFLFFEMNTGRGGHHLEYVHHLYVEAIKIIDSEFVFVVPDKIKTAETDFEWPKSDNIQMDFVPDKKVLEIRHSGRLWRTVKNVKLMREYVKKHKPDEIFLISLINFMPFLPLIIPSPVKCSGIIYMIYLYQWKKMSYLKKIGNVLLYSMFSKSKIFSRIFILNDSSAAVYLNKLYKSEKFYYLPDPIVNYPWKEIDIRNKYKIAPNEKIFLQCGILSSRKSTIEILEAIRYINRKDFCFVFAGKVSAEIKDILYELVEELSSSHHIIVEDNYLSYDMMFSLLKNSDYVFTLYSETSLSSGFVGHAANFARPVITCPDGLIGKLVRNNHLGYFVKSLEPKFLAQSLIQISQVSNIIKSDYVRTHSINSFCKKILNA